jgi:putative ABC transport system substrate-binding protein
MKRVAKSRWSPAIAAALIALTTIAAAAPPGRLVRIGVLSESWGPTPQIVGMRDGLRELGYLEDQDFTIGVRFTQGNPAELPQAARDLVRLGVDLIVAGETSNAVHAAQAATSRIPIVFIGGTDPVGFGLVKSLAHPGGNVTGVADLDLELTAKRMEIFREIVPGLKRLIFVYDPSASNTDAVLRAHRDAARRLGLAFVERPVGSREEAQAAIAAIPKSTTDGVLAPRPLSLNIPGFLLEARATVPTMFYSNFLVEQGGLASYAATPRELGRQAATLIDKILKGARPADLPVQQPTKFELAVNLKTAKALGLVIPPAVLMRADRVIQ